MKTETAAETTTFTPGPWQAISHNDTDVAVNSETCPWIVEEVDGYSIAYVLGDVPELNAELNARLIAAAPDLLEALKNLLEEASDCWRIGEHYDGRDGVIIAAHNAIAKAEGEAPSVEQEGSDKHAGHLLSQTPTVSSAKRLGEL